MRLTCPACGHVGDLAGYLGHEDAREAASVVAALPAPLGRMGLAYLDLFRPVSGRALAPAKLLRLAHELAGLVMAQEIRWDGKRALPNHPAHWAGAMEAVAEKAAQGNLRRPLTSHGLLRAIAHGIADRAAEDALRREEARLRQPGTAAPAQTAGGPLSREELARRLAARNTRGGGS